MFSVSLNHIKDSSWTLNSHFSLWGSAQLFFVRLKKSCCLNVIAFKSCASCPLLHIQAATSPVIHVLPWEVQPRSGALQPAVVSLSEEQSHIRAPCFHSSELIFSHNDTHCVTLTSPSLRTHTPRHTHTHIYTPSCPFPHSWWLCALLNTRALGKKRRELLDQVTGHQGKL